MYTVIKIKANGVVNKKRFETAEKALHYISIYNEDDSGDFRTIYMVDEHSDEILRVLLFDKNGVFEVNLGVGDTVSFRPKFCEARERNLIFSLDKIGIDLSTCLVTCLNSGSFFSPVPVYEEVHLHTLMPCTEKVGMSFFF